MSLKICVIASGSSGNCTYLASDSTSLLVDAGLSCRRIQLGLESLGVELDSVNGVCVTHEHGDHTSALSVLHRRANLPLYANSGTVEALQRTAKANDLPWNVFSTGQPFKVGDLTVSPFSVPHDSYDPVGFVVSSDTEKIGIVTDMGSDTMLVRERLRGCRILVVESNHDEEMLRQAKRPWSLKQRIAGRQGHLSNRQAGELVAELADTDTHTVFLAHISSDCNRPELAQSTVSRILEEKGLSHVAVRLTYPDRISDIVEI
jgi:phosphoribosyl 1,2-cyclic phosphodiesterase